jgi:hypothetical protein
VQSAYRGRGLYNTAAEGISRAGAEIGSGIASAGQAAVDYMAHREISTGSKTDADMLFNLTNNWNDTAKNVDPNDQSVAKKWTEETLEPALEQFQKGFLTEKGQNWAEARADRLRQHFFETTAADMSTLAGVAVHNNAHDLANKFSNTAINDPSAVPFLLESVDSHIADIVASSPNLKGAAAAKVQSETAQQIKEEIIKSGMFGAIGKAADPEAIVRQWAQRYPDFVNGIEAEAMARTAKVQARSNLASAKQAAAYQKEIDNQNVAAARNKIWTDNVSVDANGRVNIKPEFFQQATQLPAQYPNAPNATETAKTLLDWGDRQQMGATTVSDPTTKSALLTQFADPANPLTKLDVLKAEAANKITNRDGTLMREMIDQRDGGRQDPVFQAVIGAAKERVGESTIVDGHERFATFMMSFWPQYERARAAGNLPLNALDLKDPKSMISQAIKQYEPSPAEKMQGHILKSMGASNAGGSFSLGASSPAAATPRVTTQEEYDKLAPGTIYISTNGQPHRKP